MVEWWQRKTLWRWRNEEIDRTDRAGGLAAGGDAADRRFPGFAVAVDLQKEPFIAPGEERDIRVADAATTSRIEILFDFAMPGRASQGAVKAILFRK